jgi:exopolysaccharide production protein ExoQ
MKSRIRSWALPAFAVFSLFTLLAGDFWRDLLGWVPFFIICGFSVTIWAVLLVRGWDRIRHRGLPLTLVVFISWACLSVTWSSYQGATALAAGVLICTTISAFGLAYLLPWSSFVRALGLTLRWILGLSVAFELYVALILQHPVLPIWQHVKGIAPGEFYWCEGKFFQGGPIQGIVGNRNLLGFIALLAIVTFSVQLADNLISRVAGYFWLVVSYACIVLTQSATVIFAMVLVLICGALALWARRRGDGRHRLVYWTALWSFVGVAILATIAGPLIATTIGRSPDFTGRADIWQIVIHMWEQRPVLGWGWISYWAPWVAPFDHLVVRHGVTYLQAHDVWLDVGMQLGIIGLAMFVVLVGTALWRGWFRAVDRPRWDLDVRRPFVSLHMMPLFILACLGAQSLTESRMLIEGGWALLVIAAVATKLPDTLNEHPALLAPDPRLVP